MFNRSILEKGNIEEKLIILEKGNIEEILIILKKENNEIIDNVLWLSIRGIKKKMYIFAWSQPLFLIM